LSTKSVSTEYGLILMVILILILVLILILNSPVSHLTGSKAADWDEGFKLQVVESGSRE
jgi:hypothetical protein